MDITKLGVNIELVKTSYITHIICWQNKQPHINLPMKSNTCICIVNLHHNEVLMTTKRLCTDKFLLEILKINEMLHTFLRKL